MIPIVGVALLIAALLAAGGIAAAILPAASIRITPRAKPVGPIAYDITPTDQQEIKGELSSTLSGEATGDHVERAQAAGSVVFQSGNPGRCRVPAGTRLAAGDIAFETVDSVVVPEGKFTGRGIKPGAASAGIVAVEPGPGGNVPAHAIDTIQDPGLSFCLRGFPNTSHRLVDNAEATVGGDETHTPEITQHDIDTLVDRIREALAQQLAGELKAHPEMLVVAPAQPEKAAVEVPPKLEGKRGDASFELTGTLAYDRPAVTREDVEAGARTKLEQDEGKLPPGTVLDPESIQVKVGDPALQADAVSVPVDVTATAVPELDTAAIRSEVAGLTAADAQAALADLGDVEVDLWPGWVSRVPGMDWRVDVQVGSVEPTELRPSASP